METEVYGWVRCPSSILKWGRQPEILRSVAKGFPLLLMQISISLFFFLAIKYVILFQNSTLDPHTTGNNWVVGNVSCHWQLLKTDWGGAEIRHADRDSGKDYIGLNGNNQGNGKDARYQPSWIIQPYKVQQACLKMQNVVHTRQNACPYLPEIPNIKENGRKKK